jgi:S1-C subfamily serine protease
MVKRLLRIPIWIVAALMATFVIESSARAAVPQCAQHPCQAAPQCGQQPLQAVPQCGQQPCQAVPQCAQQPCQAAPQCGQQPFRIVTPDVGHVITRDVTPEVAQNLGICPADGVLISEIMYGPLRAGDVILSVNGHPVRCQGELNEQLAQVSPGAVFLVEVFRDGRTQTVSVRRDTEFPPGCAILAGATEIRGIRVASLSNQVGVLVTNVQIGTPASDAGVRSGDIILDVDGHPVRTATEFQDFLRQLGNRSATFDVQQCNGQVNVFTLPY